MVSKKRGKSIEFTLFLCDYIDRKATKNQTIEIWGDMK